MPSKRLAERLGQYLEELEKDRGLTETSLRNYESTLHRFVASRSSLTPNSVRAFLRQFTHPDTRNVHLKRIRGFARFLGTDLSTIQPSKCEIKEPQALTSQEVTRLVREVERSDRAFANVICLLAETGLRFDEFCSLTPASLKQRGSVTFLAIIGKGRKQRKVPLTAKALQAFNQLTFFPDTYFQKRFRSVLAEAGKRADMPYHCHPHLLRATFITVAVNEKKMEPALVARIVGHASVDTMVKHYLGESIERLYDALVA